MLTFLRVFPLKAANSTFLTPTFITVTSANEKPRGNDNLDSLQMALSFAKYRIMNILNKEFEGISKETLFNGTKYWFCLFECLVWK